MTEKIQYIPSRLKNAAVGGHVAGAEDIKDDALEKEQSQINQEVIEAMNDRYTKEQTYSKEQLNSMITTPEQKNVTLTAEDGDTLSDIFDGVTGAADTIYRVGSWDGTQYDTTKYAEYAFDGTNFILLDVKEVGIDDEPTAGSENLVKSGGCISSIGEGSFMSNFNVTKNGSTAINTGTYLSFTLDKYYKIFCRSTSNKITYINIVINLGSGKYQVVSVPNGSYIIFKCERTVSSINIQNTETIDGTDNITLSFYSLNDLSKEVQLFLLGKLTETIDAEPTKQSSNLVYSGGVANKEEAIDAKFFIHSVYSGLLGDTGTGYISASTQTLNSFVYPVVEGETYCIHGYEPLNGKALFTKSQPQADNIAVIVAITDGKVTVPSGYTYMMIDVYVPNINYLDECFVYIDSILGKSVIRLTNNFKVKYNWEDFPCYGIWVNGLAYDTGQNSFHSDLISLDKAKHVNIKTAIATSNYAYCVLDENYEIITSQTPPDTSLYQYSFDVTSGMKYLQVNCFSKFLGTFYQSFFIEIFYDEPIEKYKPKRIMCYGDSLTRGTAGGSGYSYPWHLQKLIGNGYQPENRGAGGETVPAIITRTGASPIIVTSDFVLPADTTPVQLGQTLTTMYGNKSFVFAQGGNLEKMMVNPCWVKGVECFIDYVNGNYQINRLEAGDAIKVPAGTSIYCGDRERYDNISYAVLFAGTNGGYSTATELADMLEKTGDYMDVPYIVLNFWGTGNLPQGVTISDIQTEFRNRFGGRFLDIMLYFSTAAIYDAINQDLVEIDEPTQADLNNMAQGLPPASLMLEDNLHLNDAGKILLAQQVYAVLKMYGIGSN